MKYLSIILCCTLSLILTSSCDQNKHALLRKEFINGKVKIEVEGVREGALTPFFTTIHVKAYDFEKGGLKFEFFADDINDQNVSFNWLDNDNCEILFTDKEGAHRKFHLMVNSEQLQLGEVSQ